MAQRLETDFINYTHITYARVFRNSQDFIEICLIYRATDGGVSFSKIFEIFW